MHCIHPLFTACRSATLALACIAALSWWSPWATAQGAATPSELTLYGVRLKDASVADFVLAATAAGVKPLDARPDAPLTFDTREAGVPALQRLTLITDATGHFVSAQFLIKPYGQENEALRQLLVRKYGLPMTADGARRPFPSYAGRFAPRGSFDWDFAGGMKLVYRQPVIGDATLSYTDIEKARQQVPPAAAAGSSPAAQGDLSDRF